MSVAVGFEYVTMLFYTKKGAGNSRICSLGSYSYFTFPLSLTSPFKGNYANFNENGLF